MIISKTAALRSVVLLYLITTSAPDIGTGSSVITLPVLATFPLVCALFFFKVKVRVARESYLLIAAFAICAVMSVVNFSYAGAITLRHHYAFVFCFFSFYLLPQSLLQRGARADGGLYEFILKCMERIVLVTCAAVILEYFVKNFLGLPFDEYVYHARTEFDATFGLGQFRARGFFSESGHAAMYLESVGLISIVFGFVTRSRLRFLVCAVWLLAQYCLFSVGSIIVILASCSIYILFARRIRPKVRFWSLFGLGVGVLTLAGALVSDQALLNGFLAKASILSVNNIQEGSASERSDVYGAAINCALQEPFGIGWGIAPSLKLSANVELCRVYAGQISLPLEFLVAGGFLALMLFLGWFAQSGLKILWGTYPSNLFAIPLISLLLHFFVVSDYWVPTLWIALILSRIAAIQAARPNFRDGFSPSNVYRSYINARGPVA